MQKLTFWLYTGFFLRLINSFYNGFFGPSFGASADAFWFHELAADYSINLVLEEFWYGRIYAYALGVFYYITMPSLFLGSVLSTLAWFFSAIILVRIMNILLFRRSLQWKIMFIFALLPSSLIYTSVTMREPFQLLFINLSIYAACKIYYHKSVFHWLVLGFSLFCAGTLHGALLATSIFICIGTLFLVAFRNRKAMSIYKFLLLTPIIALCFYFGVLILFNVTYDMDAGLAASVQEYQEASMAYKGRATYRSEIEIDGLVGLLFSIPILFFQYMFEPMPWNMSASVDVVALLENFLRFILLFNAMKYLFSSYITKPKFLGSDVLVDRHLILFITLTLLLTETIWSLGTTNWGTSIRHHLPSCGLLLVVGFAYQNIRSKRSKRSQKI